MPHQRERNAVHSQSRQATPGTIRFAIKLAWDGTDYQGFQSQPHGNTIQDQIEARLKKMLKRPLRIFGWGRTDSGVHAQGAVITVDLTQEEVARFALARKEDESACTSNHSLLAAKTLHSALKEFSCDGGLGSITARSVIPVPIDFDPRFSSVWKRYVYLITWGTKSPFLNRFAWHVEQPLDVGKMTGAAALLTGTHNFEWMSLYQEGELRDPVRTLSIEVQIIDAGPFGQETSMMKVLATCDFFLYRMMRRIVGILISIGSGRANELQLAHCLTAHDAGTSCSIPSPLLNTAPAKGLCLDHIEYEILI